MSATGEPLAFQPRLALKCVRSTRSPSSKSARFGMTRRSPPLSGDEKSGLPIKCTLEPCAPVARELSLSTIARDASHTRRTSSGRADGGKRSTSVSANMKPLLRQLRLELDLGRAGADVMPLGAVTLVEWASGRSRAQRRLTLRHCTVAAHNKQLDGPLPGKRCPQPPRPRAPREKSAPVRVTGAPPTSRDAVAVAKRPYAHPSARARDGRIQLRRRHGASTPIRLGARGRRVAVGVASRVHQPCHEGATHVHRQSALVEVPTVARTVQDAVLLTP
eukprot:2606650-Prymnesium_polylepis.2